MDSIHSSKRCNFFSCLKRAWQAKFTQDMPWPLVLVAFNPSLNHTNPIFLFKCTQKTTKLFTIQSWENQLSNYVIIVNCDICCYYNLLATKFNPLMKCTGNINFLVVQGITLEDTAWF